MNSHDAALREANGHQQAGSDPGASVFVDANAGSGKTRVLVNRLLRLMLGGAPPGRIQCLTFTRAAAAEMNLRLQRTLGSWVTLDDRGLDAALGGMGVTPTPTLRERARTLFAEVLDLPGGMRIGTIHAFCQSLLRRFPLEAELSPHFTVVEDAEARQSLDDVREQVVAETAPEVVAALAALAKSDDAGKLLASLHAARDRLDRLLALPPGARRQSIRRAAGAVHASEAAWAEAAVHPPEEDALRRLLQDIAAHGSDSARIRFAGPMQGWLAQDAAGRLAGWDHWAGALLTQKGTPRAGKDLANKAVLARSPEAHELLGREGARLGELAAQRIALRAAATVEALLALAAPILHRYEGKRQGAAQLDHADIIGRADRLLETPGAAWVLYKLDGGLDHLLLDEVQDTAPEQWRIAHRLTEEFFAGLGARDAQRSFFAVGDPKQSIYSFQGADPAAFQHSRAEMRERVQAAGQVWRDVPLQVSFRSTDAVLGLVDAVFAEGPARDGVAEDDTPVRHVAARTGMAGRVELWPVTPRQAREERAPWTVPEAYQRAPSERQRLADAIAAWAADLLARREVLPARGRPVQAGDILVLVRRRDAFAHALVRALKARGVKVAGLDRLVLIDQPAVQDLLALLDAILLPQDDLQVACVLTSPLGGLSDPSLMALAMDRRGTLWDELRVRSAERADWAAAWRMLSTLQSRADHVTPHALLSEALGLLGGRARLFARLGPEAAEPVDELLNAALDYATLHPPSLQGFAHWIRTAADELKREAGGAGDAVRIMTVHGAKGLEAPVVVLPDTTGFPPNKDTLVWCQDPETGIDVPLWAPTKDLRCANAEAAARRTRALALQEYNRQLYVALTRAEDRLVVCGWENARKESGALSWYDAIAAGFDRLGAGREAFTAWDGERRVLETAQAGAPRDERSDAPPPGPPLPEWAGGAPAWRPHALPPEPPLPIPIAPSRPEGVAEGPSPAAASPLLQAAGPGARLRGQVAHRLLQHLPALAEGERAAAALLHAERAGLERAEAEAITREVLGVLDDPALAALFGPGSRAEQPLAGLVDGMVVSGVVDRIMVMPDRVLLADWKTNRVPPDDPARTPVAYLRQMAAYRAVLRLLFPGRAVICTLVWTWGGARPMRLPDALLDQYRPGSHGAHAGVIQASAA